jgi:hemerythrin-like domain-containing protein
MAQESIRTIRAEHSALAAMLQSMAMMVQRGPGDTPEMFFDVLRAMLFYVDEFPERLHHPKETELLFPPVARLAPETQDTIAKLSHDHQQGEAAIRELQHLLLGWEQLGDARRAAFEQAAARYHDFYLDHMRLEEQVILPAAIRVLSDADWNALDNAFASHRDLLVHQTDRDPIYDRLFTRIVMRAPAPIGVGDG